MIIMIITISSLILNIIYLFGRRMLTGETSSTAPCCATTTPGGHAGSGRISIHILILLLLLLDIIIHICVYIYIYILHIFVYIYTLYIQAMV